MKRTLKRFFFYIYILHHRFLHRIGVLPYDRHFGVGRGTPVGRYYVDKFLKENAEFVRGRCLEFGNARYKSFFPGIGKHEVVDISAHAGVDYVCDIHDATGIPKGTFDAVICTQVFNQLAWPEKAAVSIFQLLRPGGVLLLTAPFLNPVDKAPTDFRRFTPDALDLILRAAGFAIDSISFGGNSNVGLGSLLGMVMEDFSIAEMEVRDPAYPYNCLIRAHRPEGAQ
jgi:SAM-dependent methyltransferase